jgi:hypothetical protein
MSACYLHYKLTYRLASSQDICMLPTLQINLQVSFYSRYLHATYTINLPLAAPFTKHSALRHPIYSPTANALPSIQPVQINNHQTTTFTVIYILLSTPYSVTQTRLKIRTALQICWFCVAATRLCVSLITALCVCCRQQLFVCTADSSCFCALLIAVVCVCC